VAVEGLLFLLVFAWFGLHIGSPDGSNLSRIAGALLALTFLELLVVFAIHGAA
jgi:hypothetical protein